MFGCPQPLEVLDLGELVAVRAEGGGLVLRLRGQEVTLKVTRLEAERLLERSAGGGNMVLRPGGHGRGISVTTRQELNGAVLLKHYRVNRVDRGYVIDVDAPVSDGDRDPAHPLLPPTRAPGLAPKGLAPMGSDNPKAGHPKAWVPSRSWEPPPPAQGKEPWELGPPPGDRDPQGSGPPQDWDP
ncbi:signal-transducing adaptor protein 2 [Grus japonensis]|uniref:Signal-transducing adaptor protein 2 n=1 Tax=Grus japonensis TaxID=30415 RepID=A0ABC9XTI9_GRUJA